MSKSPQLHATDTGDHDKDWKWRKDGSCRKRLYEELDLRTSDSDDGDGDEAALALRERRRQRKSARQDAVRRHEAQEKEAIDGRGDGGSVNCDMSRSSVADVQGYMLIKQNRFEEQSSSSGMPEDQWKAVLATSCKLLETTEAEYHRLWNERFFPLAEEEYHRRCEVNPSAAESELDTIWSEVCSQHYAPCSVAVEESGLVRSALADGQAAWDAWEAGFIRPHYSASAAEYITAFSHCSFAPSKPHLFSVPKRLAASKRQLKHLQSVAASESAEEPPDELIGRAREEVDTLRKQRRFDDETASLNHWGPPSTTATAQPTAGQEKQQTVTCSSLTDDGAGGLSEMMGRIVLCSRPTASASGMPTR